MPFSLAISMFLSCLVHSEFSTLTALYGYTASASALELLYIISIFAFSITVGYVKLTVEGSDYLAIASQFEECGKPVAPIAIDKLFTIAEPAADTSLGVTMDQIWRFEKAWVKYGYVKTGKGKSATYAWKKYLRTEWDEEEQEDVDIWAELDPETDVVQPGETVLFFRGGDDAVEITLNGQVKPFTASKDYDIEGSDYKFIGYPWPVNFYIGDITSYYDEDCEPASDSSLGVTMDQVWRFDKAWVKYGYVKTGKGKSATYAWKKYLRTEYDDEAGEDVDVWEELDPAKDFVKPGQGMLFFRGGDDPLTIHFTFAE